MICACFVCTNVFSIFALDIGVSWSLVECFSPFMFFCVVALAVVMSLSLVDRLSPHSLLTRALVHIAPLAFEIHIAITWT